MAAWSWRTWPDVLIDFGREAYVAWRLAEGAVLHRDVVYVSGPLSPYWNAAVFRVLGDGLDSLFAVNALLLALLCAVWFGLLRFVADRAAAWAGCAVLLTVFGFAQYVGIGNYNYLAPYSHELPHGLLLASLGIAAWTRAAGRRPSGWDAGAGLAFGLVALTKIEVLVAAAAANALAFAFLARREPAADAARRLARFAVGALLPPGVAVALLASPLGFAGAVEAVAIGPLRLLGDDLAGLPFYQRGLGSDDLPRNAGLALLWALKLAALFVPAWAAATLLRQPRQRGVAAQVAAAVAMAAVLAPFSAGIAWLQAARSLPVLMLAAGAACLWGLRGRAAADREGAVALVRAMLVTFATVLLAKIFFNARVYQYGFALAMPASLVLVAALVSWLPAELTRRGAAGGVFRAAALAVLGVTVAAHLWLMAPFFEAKTSRLGGVDDAFRVQPAFARILGGALEEVNARTRPGDTLAVLPEGVMLNFLTRRPTPTPHFSFNPFELHVYGEDEMIAAFAASPPAAVVLIHHDTSEHGARFLGRNYGVALLAWIREHYRTARQIGDAPLEPGSRFGVQILERKDRPRRVERGG